MLKLLAGLSFLTLMTGSHSLAYEGWAVHEGLGEEQNCDDEGFYGCVKVKCSCQFKDGTYIVVPGYGRSYAEAVSSARRICYRNIPTQGPESGTLRRCRRVSP